MRSIADRIRQALSFELIGLSIVTPLASWIFGFEMMEIGGLALISATVATVWNYIYNLGFDHALRRFFGRTQKTLPLRVVHAVCFEAGLLLALLPIFAWWLDITLVQAFVMDVSFSAFYLVYAFVFTWAYDTVFPIPEPAAQEAAE